MKYRLKIEHDTDCSSPREDDVNLGVIIAWHPRMKLGDENVVMRNYADANDVRAKSVPEDAICCLPVYMYEHSGCTIRTKSFHDRFDSGQVGWIYTTPAKLRETHGDVVPPTEEVEKWLAQEVDYYDQWIRGNTWGFQLERVTTCSECGAEKTEDVDSCWGFIGSDNDTRDAIGEHLPEEAMPLLQAAWDNRS